MKNAAQSPSSNEPKNHQKQKVTKPRCIINRFQLPHALNLSSVCFPVSSSTYASPDHRHRFHSHILSSHPTSPDLVVLGHHFTSRASTPAPTTNHQPPYHVHDKLVSLPPLSPTPTGDNNLDSSLHFPEPNTPLHLLTLNQNCSQYIYRWQTCNYKHSSSWALCLFITIFVYLLM